MRARISKKGYEILDDSKAADSLVAAIIANEEKLMAGESVEFQFQSKADPSQLLTRTVQVVSSAAAPIS